MEILAVGLPVPQGRWQGTVHSVFHQSVNLRVPGTGLLCVHRFGFGLLPGSYYVPQLETAGLRPGDPVRGDENGLELGGEWYDLSPAAAWVDTAIPRRDREKIDPVQWRRCRRELDRRQESGDGEMTEELYRRLRRDIIKLRKGLREGEKEEVRRQCEAMVGLGQGLTPTGDDMLLGSLAALTMYEPELGAALAEAVTPLLDRTNDISASYLRQAVEGRAATPVTGAMEALVTGAWEPVETLLQVGHSSGGDILEGIVSMTEPRERKGTR